MQIAELEQGRPKDGQGRCAQELACYDLLDRLQIDYLRADHTEAATMEDCQAVEKALQGPICKNLFLCRRRFPTHVLRFRQLRFRSSSIHSRVWLGLCSKP